MSWELKISWWWENQLKKSTKLLTKLLPLYRKTLKFWSFLEYTKKKVIHESLIFQSFSTTQKLSFLFQDHNSQPWSSKLVSATNSSHIVAKFDMLPQVSFSFIWILGIHWSKKSQNWLNFRFGKFLFTYNKNYIWLQCVALQGFCCSCWHHSKVECSSSLCSIIFLFLLLSRIQPCFCVFLAFTLFPDLSFLCGTNCLSR